MRGNIDPGDLTAYLQQEGRRRAAELAAAMQSHAFSRPDGGQIGQLQCGVDPAGPPPRSLSEALQRMGIAATRQGATPRATGL
ncbi:MAG: hypothetical protein B7X59_15320 [Polaromonas sp. 39-63-203]|uniref:hypothetical protein n=1 Tax=Polaromonas sp. TaxID=1869339 RepID=UPI000BDA5BF9|nr:hypothetical protein [Polaromonas sp.]OZA92816.1 MAG: hypothetical protein B7X59_15320 [Polaromonas sp. 39-63-203]HQS33540.1 hypothetical protein [Polaromonas sp.]HQS92940.1 hypothetical protein [Polaromonas sp.]